jgi:1-phosphofructokinase family hexose kinase
MIITVTPNTALDRVIFIKKYDRGNPVRTTRWKDCLGGKALDSSVTLSCLGVQNIAMGFLAGNVGRDIVHIMEAYGISHDMVWINGESRLSHVIVETEDYAHTTILLGNNIILPSQYQEFFRRFKANLWASDFVITGGSLPTGFQEDFYLELTEATHAAGKPILIDSRHDPMLRGLPAKPDIIKMNNDEFVQTFNLASSSIMDIAVSGRKVLEEHGLDTFIVTCGKEGILAIRRDKTYLAKAPRQQAVNAAGAGDAVSASLAWRLSQGDTWMDALMWAAATSAASVLTEGTAEVRMEDVMLMKPECVVREL